MVRTALRLPILTTLRAVTAAMEGTREAAESSSRAVSCRFRAAISREIAPSEAKAAPVVLRVRTSRCAPADSWLSTRDWVGSEAGKADAAVRERTDSRTPEALAARAATGESAATAAAAATVAWEKAVVFTSPTES
jgi:hypothetical protein